MEIRQLEYFRKIAQTGSINEAARQLNMSQPPLSYQLKLLEEELEAALVGEHDAVSSLTQGTVEFQKIGKGELTKQLVLIEHDLERLLRERGRFGREGVCLAF